MRQPVFQLKRDANFDLAAFADDVEMIAALLFVRPRKRPLLSDLRLIFTGWECSPHSIAVALNLKNVVEFEQRRLDFIPGATRKFGKIIKLLRSDFLATGSARSIATSFATGETFVRAFAQTMELRLMA